MTQTVKSLKASLRALRSEMRALGIKKTSPFNGGMDRETQRWNERRFALETAIERAEKAAPPFVDISHEDGIRYPITVRVF